LKPGSGSTIGADTGISISGGFSKIIQIAPGQIKLEPGLDTTNKTADMHLSNVSPVTSVSATILAGGTIEIVSSVPTTANNTAIKGNEILTTTQSALVPGRITGTPVAGTELAPNAVRNQMDTRIASAVPGLIQFDPNIKVIAVDTTGKVLLNDPNIKL